MSQNCRPRSKPGLAVEGQVLAILPETQGPERIAELEYFVLVPVALVGQGLVRVVQSLGPVPWKLKVQLMTVQSF